MASHSNKSVAKLFVHVIQAERVKSADFGGTSDPYCIVGVKGDHASEHKTNVIDKTLNPEWHEKFVFHPSEAQMETGILQVQVFDYDKVGSDDLLGEVEIPLANFQTKRN